MRPSKRIDGGNAIGVVMQAGRHGGTCPSSERRVRRAPAGGLAAVENGRIYGKGMNAARQRCERGLLKGVGSLNPKVLAMAVIAAAVVWAVGFVFVPRAKQDALFYANGQDLMSDYRMPRTCAAASDPYRAEAIEQKDRCYAALGYVVASAFPRDTIRGGIVFNVVGAGLFLLAAGLLMRRLGAEQWLILGTVALSAPFLYNIERANQVWLAGAGVMVFLAWFESESRWKRLAALAALAAAAALKITPGIFALLLLKNRRWKDLVLLSVLGLALLILPFFCYDGFESFQEWRGCLQEHAQYYSTLKGWGFVKFARTGLLRLRGVEMELQSALYYATAGLDLLMGLAAVWAFFRAKDRRMEIWAIGLALVLLPAVSQYYTALYLVPAFLLLAGRRLSLPEAFLWFLLLCPLQFPASTTSLNRLIANFAVLGMVVNMVKYTAKG